MTRRSGAGGQVLARESFLDQFDRLIDAVKSDERTHARPLGLAQQDFIERLEPVTQVFKAVAFADFVNFRLQVFGLGLGIHRAERIGEVFEGRMLTLGRGPVRLGRFDEIPIIADRRGDQTIQKRRIFRRQVRAVARNEMPQDRFILGPAHTRQVQQDVVAERPLGFRRVAGMNVPDRIGQLLVVVLILERGQMAEIIIDVFRDHVIPKNVDDYLSHLAAFEDQDDDKKLSNPVWHIHSGNPPEAQGALSYNILLNLAGVCGTEDKSVLWHFISRYRPDLTPENAPFLDGLVATAISYYRDFVKPAKTYRAPTEGEHAALEDLANSLRSMDTKAEAEDLQTEVYEVGKRHGFENLRDWFKALYEILLGQSQGPRMGSFIALYGVNETVELIEKALAGEDLAASA